MCGSTQNFGPIGSAVLTFIGYKQTDRQTDRQTDKPNSYIDMTTLIFFLKIHEIFVKIRELFCFVLQLHKENMLSIK